MSGGFSPDNAAFMQYLYFLWIESVQVMNRWLKIYEDWMDLFWYKNIEKG